MQIDPELERQLDDSEPEDARVEAIFTLKSELGSQREPQQVKEVAQHIVKRAEEATGRPSESVNVLANMGQLIIAADRSLVRELTQQPEFDYAASNTAPEDDGDVRHT